MTEKIRDIDGYDKFLADEDIANIFNIYTDTKLGEPYKIYNMNKAVILKGLNDIPITSFSFYEVQNHDTWNLISHKVYGTIKLWWLILKTNNITNSMVEPQPGWVLKILPKAILSKILVEMKRG